MNTANITTEEKARAYDEALYRFLMEVFEMQKEPNPSEWSEEDKKFFELLHAALYQIKVRIGKDEYDRAIARLKSLRQQPKVEWSKEDEEKIERLAFLISVVAEKEMISEEECIDLRRFVKSYCPQYKREWSKEDKEKLHQVIATLSVDKEIAIREYPFCKPLQKSYDNMISFLESLLSSYKPSEEHASSFSETQNNHDALADYARKKAEEFLSVFKEYECFSDDEIRSLRTLLMSMFFEGLDWQKEQMMKNAVNAMVHLEPGANPIVTIGVGRFGLKVRDKVRVIILKKED